MVARISPANRADSRLLAEITSGGCGFCSGRGQIDTWRNWKCSPSQPNGSGSVHALRMSAIASRWRDHDASGGMLYAMYSCGMPRIRPATRRPPLMQSSIAYSSATRTGLLSGTRLPIIAMRIFLVGYASAPPIRLQFAISPYGLKWCSLQPTQSKPQRSAYTIVST
jgi:hypothetical protein